MRWFLANFTVAACCAFSAVAAAGHAGTIRHDRSDALYTGLAADPAFAAVGKLTWTESTSGFLASGTLIADQWLLTAAHVVDGTDGLGAGINNLRFDVGGRTYSADEWFAHPNWAASGGEQNLFAGWDIALVRLDQSVTNVQPSVLFTDTNELGQVATLMGFGATGTGLTGAQPNTAGTKRAGQNIVDIVGTEQTPGSVVSIGHDRMLAVDFDRPGVASESTLGSPVPLDLEYLTAPGDSGGGLFLEVGGQQLLAGVTALGSTLDQDADSDYGDRAAFTRVSRFIDWISQTMHANVVVNLPGDYDGNGVVDATDFSVLKSLFGSTENLAAVGNGDGVVNAADYTIWRDNLGATRFGGGAAIASLPGQTVPEPTSGVIAASVLVAFATTAIGRPCRLFQCRYARQMQT